MLNLTEFAKRSMDTSAAMQKDITEVYAAEEEASTSDCAPGASLLRYTLQNLPPKAALKKAAQHVLLKQSEKYYFLAQFTSIITVSEQLERGFARISLFLPRLPNLPGQCFSNGTGNLTVWAAINLCASTCNNDLTFKIP